MGSRVVRDKPAYVKDADGGLLLGGDGGGDGEYGGFGNDGDVGDSDDEDVTKMDGKVSTLLVCNTLAAIFLCVIYL